MKQKLFVGKMVATVIVSALLILIACTKKEAPSAPTNLTAVLNGECIHLSWNKVSHADYYRISVAFEARDQHNNPIGTYEVFLCETSSAVYEDRFPFEGTNYYKIEAVNEYGSSTCSEVSCYYPVNETVFLYPNPAINRVALKPSLESPNNINHLTVMNNLGQEVCDVNFIGSVELDTSQCESGIYLAHLFSENGEIIKRLVVAHE